MNAPIVSPSAKATAPLSEASARIRGRADRMAEMTRRAGVTPDEPLGLMLESFHDVAVAFEEASVATAEQIGRTIKNTRDLSIHEVHKLHEANKLAHQAMESFKVKGEVLEKQAQLAVGEFMQTIEPLLVNALRGISVVKQQQWNRRQNLQGVIVVSSVLLGVFAGGYIWGGGNLQGHAPGIAAAAAVERCRTAAQPDRTSGEKWCPVKVLDEPK